MEGRREAWNLLLVGRELKLNLDGWQLFDKRFGKMLREMNGGP